MDINNDNEYKKVWFNNPKILIDTFYKQLENLGLDFNNFKYSNYEKSNLIMLIIIFLIIIIFLFKLNKTFFFIPLLLLFYSIYITNNTFYLNKIFNNNNIDCQHPTYLNPFMNYTIGDAISNPNRLQACKYDDVKKDIKQKFRSGLYSDITNLWGKQISDLNFYTMPNSNIVNNSIGFANWCYTNNDKSGKCKIDGSDCKINDNTYFISRIINK